MLFDEKKRQELMNLYSALPSHERRAYRLLSVIYVPMSIGKITTACMAVVEGLKGSTKRRFAENTASMIERWETAGLVESVIISGHKYWFCGRLTREPATREAIANGEFGYFDDAVRKLPEMAPKRSMFEKKDSCVRAAAFYREARRAYYSGDSELHSKLFGDSANARPEETTRAMFGPQHLHPVVEILCNPIDDGVLSGLPEEIGAPSLDIAMSFFSSSTEEAPILRGILKKYWESYYDSSSLAMTICLDELLLGRLDEAESLLESLEARGRNSGTECVRGGLCTMRGNADEALLHYDEGMKMLRSETKKRKVSFPLWCGVFYPILTARGELTQGLPLSAKTRKNLDSYIESATVPGACLRDSHKMIKFIFAEGSGRSGIFAHEIIDSLLVPKHVLDPFFFMLCASWIDAKSAGEHFDAALDSYKRMETLGMDYFARQMASIIKDLLPESAEKFDSSPAPPYSLKNLLELEADWRRSLSLLAETGEIQKNTSGARLVWEISWRPSENGVPSATRIRPLERTISDKGKWSKGKPVALKRLIENPETVGGFTDRDRTALQAIKKNHNHWGGEFYIDVSNILRLLAGHPYLERAEDGGVVEITAETPRILARSLGKSGAGYLLSMTPYPNVFDRNSGMILTEEGHNRLKITLLDERHFKMARILGPKGLSVPESARDAILGTLNSVSSIVTVHSDIEGITGGPEFVPPDSGLCVQLQPRGVGLDVEALTRPLGRDGPSCSPGVGGTNMFGLSGGRRVQTRRDLTAETGALFFLVSSCWALSKADQISENRWQILDVETSLEFLLQLGPISRSVTIEWPKGGAMSVTSLNPSSMSISMHNSREWLAASGHVKVEDGLVLGFGELLKLIRASSGRFITIGEGKFAALAEEFRRRLDDLSSVGEAHGDIMRFPLTAAPFISPLAEIAGSFDGSEEWKKIAALVDEASLMSPDPPATFKGELRGYQTEGYRWLMRLAHWGAGACLADDMGLGKTIQALAVLLSRAPDGPALVAAPTSVCANWLEESARFTPTLNMIDFRNEDRERSMENIGAMDVLVVSYGLLLNEGTRLSMIEWNTIVLDEAQAIKNAATKRSAAIMKLRGNFRIATTGTPIENNLFELWNIFRFINPAVLGAAESFSARFAIPIERDGSKSASSRLKRIISPFVLRRTKGAVLTELPPKTEVTMRVDMKPDERALYEAIRLNAIEELASYQGLDARFLIFAQLTRLRRACCNASLVMPHGSAPYPSAKLDAFSEIMEDLRAGGHRALVFSQFVSHLSILRGNLDQNGVPYQYLDGSTPVSERARRVKAFQAGEGDVFLISLRAGGTGLNLTAADYVIHMDPWWNPAVEEQASDRTHRIGQTRPVTVYRIVAKNTIEEKIVDLHSWKRDLAESLLDEAEIPLKLSSDEIIELIRG
ncbi:MAG: DEAD/DEAH box helicase [Synergistaceae bacterium]|jgi:superfamily II DNA or RNA helicase|nr:DEAD/DEAH box helicase [Synergistaceae bacterium]